MEKATSRIIGHGVVTLDNVSLETTALSGLAIVYKCSNSQGRIAFRPMLWLGIETPPRIHTALVRDTN